MAGVDPLGYLIVLTEGFIAFAVTYLTWRCRNSGTVALCGILLGMAWCAFLHGFSFGVLQVEGPRAAREPQLLAGFGLAAAIFLGFPLGLVIGIVLNLLRPRPNRPRKG